MCPSVYLTLGASRFGRRRAAGGAGGCSPGHASPAASAALRRQEPPRPACGPPSAAAPQPHSPQLRCATATAASHTSWVAHIGQRPDRLEYLTAIRMLSSLPTEAESDRQPPASPTAESAQFCDFQKFIMGLNFRRPDPRACSARSGRKGSGLVPGGSPRGQSWGSPTRRSGSSNRLGAADSSGGGNGSICNGNGHGNCSSSGGGNGSSGHHVNGVHSASSGPTAGNGGATAPATPDLPGTDLPTRLGISTRPSGPMQVATNPCWHTWRQATG